MHTLAAMLVLLLAHAPAYGESRDGLLVSLRSALSSEAEAKGDRHAAASAWLAALARVESSAGAMVLMARVAELEHLDVVPRDAAAAYERLLRDRDRDRFTPRAREALTERLAARYRAAGWFGREQALMRDLGYVRTWLCIGPFGHTRESAHDIEFPPERGIDLDRSYTSGWKPVRWRVLESPGSGSRIDLLAPLWPREGCAYALAQFKAPEASDAYVSLSCTGSHKMWLNSLLVANVDRGRAITATSRVWPVRIAPGWNRLLIKVTAGNTVVSCLIHDARGRPPRGLEWETKTILHGAGIPQRASHPVQRMARDELREHLQQPDLAKEDRARLHAAVGILYREEGLGHDAIDELARAVELAPGLPHLWYQYALSLERASTMPRSMRRNKARDAYERAAECEGGFCPADEASALNLQADNKPEFAIARLRKAVEDNPDSSRARLLMADIALGEGWLHEARSWAQDAEAASPDNRHVHLLWSRYYGRLRDHARSASAMRQALERDASDTTTRHRYARLLLSAGNSSAAIAELRRILEANPADIGGYHSLARMQMDVDRPGEALSTIRAALRLAPERPETHRMLGEVRLRLGDIEDAADAWRMALTIRPGWHELRGQLIELTGGVNDISKPFAIDVNKAIGESKEPEDCPGADVILVVDQTVVRIFDDGSYTEVSHQAKKALTTSGAEQLSDLSIEGELLEARTHTDDGTVLEPAVLPGRNTLTMPGMRIGSVVEYRYRRDHPAPRGGFVELPRWYFRGIKTPHQLSDYVVIAPVDMKLSVTAKHWARTHPEESFEQFAPRREGETVTYRWIARGVRHVRPEAGHDHVSTFLPHVSIGKPRAWQDINAEMLDLFLGRIRPTDALADAARSAVGDADAEKTKARAVFSHVCTVVKSDAPIYEANQILLARAGNRRVLLATMLRAAGLDVRFAVVRPRPDAIDPSTGPGEPNWALPNSRFFSDTLVCVLCEDGEKVWLDPTGPHAAFGTIAPRYHGGMALILSPDGGTLTTLPWGPLREHGETSRTRLAFDPKANTAVGSRTHVVAGWSGAAYKERFAESSSSWQETWAERRLSKSFSNARLMDLGTRDQDNAEAPFTLTARFELSEALTGSGHMRDAPMGFEQLGMVKRFVRDPTREYPLKLHSPLVRWDEATLTVGGGGAWVSPASHTEHTAFGSYSLTFTTRDNSIEIRRTITLMPQVIGPERYEEFVGFCRKVDAAEAAPLKARFGSATPVEPTRGR